MLTWTSRFASWEITWNCPNWIVWILMNLHRRDWMVRPTLKTNIVQKKRRAAPTFQALGVHKVKNNDSNCRPGDDERQDQYPGHRGAEGGVQIIHHGAFGHSCGWSTRLTSFALKDSGGGGGGPCYRKTTPGFKVSPGLHCTIFRSRDENHSSWRNFLGCTLSSTTCRKLLIRKNFRCYILLLYYQNLRFSWSSKSPPRGRAWGYAWGCGETHTTAINIILVTKKQKLNMVLGRKEVSIFPKNLFLHDLGSRWLKTWAFSFIAGRVRRSSTSNQRRSTSDLAVCYRIQSMFHWDQLNQCDKEAFKKTLSHIHWDRIFVLFIWSAVSVWQNKETLPNKQDDTDVSVGYCSNVSKASEKKNAAFISEWKMYWCGWFCQKARSKWI